MLNRLSTLSHSTYIPDLMVEKTGDQLKVLIMFVKGQPVEKGTDISGFYEFCRANNFGADTNASNFVSQEGQLKYIDGDLAEWLVSPSNHSFNEGALTRASTY